MAPGPLKDRILAGERFGYIRADKRILPAETLWRNQPPTRTPIINGRIEHPLAETVARVPEAELAAVLEQAATQSALREQLLKASLAYFAAEMIFADPRTPADGPFLIARHHLAWDEALVGSKKILTLAARAHGKSAYWARAFPIWKGGYSEPGSEGYIFSANQGLAEEILALVQLEIRRNEKLHWLIPATGERYWSKGEISLSTGTVIRARGWGVRVRGGHPQWIICDDVIDDDSAYSETIRRRSIDYFFSVPTNMLEPHGTMIIVGTPFSPMDLYAKIEETKKYTVLKFPAEDKQGNPLFPARYSKAALQDKKEEIGTLRYTREFLVSPMSDLTSLFPGYLFDQPNVRQPYCLGLGREYWEAKGWPRYTGVDLAFSAESGADFTVVFTIAIDDQGNRWIVNIRRGKGWSYSKQISEIEEEYALTRPDSISIEANQAQRVYGQNLMLTTELPIKLFFTLGTEPKKPWRKGMTTILAGKNSMDRGIPALRLGLERGKWRIPRGDAHSIELTDLWMGELNCIAFENGKIRSVGEHDDLVLSAWFANYDATRGVGIEMHVGDSAGPEPAPVERQLAVTAGGNGGTVLKPAPPPDDDALDFFGLGPEHKEPQGVNDLLGLYGPNIRRS